jgi:hypothetical protein
VSAQYVEVPAESIRGALLGAGFVLCAVPSGGATEEVFYLLHKKDPRYQVRVYSSLSSGAKSARGRGRDAIRVVVLFDGPNGRRVPLWKGKRVHRCGSVEAVVERMLERAREGYAHINGILKSPNYRRAS